MLSHVVPAARNSLSIFKDLDIFVGSVSFTPLFLYSFYLYLLSYRHFIPNLPLALQAYLKFPLAILLVVVVAINEVGSFVGISIESLSTKVPLAIGFTHNSESLWLSLSEFSLALYTTIQIIFFLLAFYRLAKAFLDQRRIELTHSDEHHFYNGIAWITVGIEIGVIETLAGFAQGSFAVALARRILRLVARFILMIGLLKGLDTAESFENLADELRGISRFSRRVSRMLGVSPRLSTFRRASQLHPHPSLAHELSPMEKQRNEQRVTVHYERGQAPFLQIRFSALDFPAQAILADTIQPRRRSCSGLIPGYAGAEGGSQQYIGANVSAEMLTLRNAVLEAPRAKSALPAPHTHPTERSRQPGRRHSRVESGGTISDNMSVVRDLERRFPNLPPRVTGRYRGSILGQGYEEDPFPVVGISREPSMRRDESVQGTSEEGAGSVGLSASGSIKRKPAPPLLASPTYISGRGNRPVSTWGGLTQNSVQYPVASPATPTSPWTGTTAYSPPTVLGGEASTPKSSRRMTPHNLFKRASKAMSDASVRSAEWLASARSHQATQPQLTPADIEMYRSGGVGSSSPRRASDDPGNVASMSGENLLPQDNRRSADDAGAGTKASPRRPRLITRVSVGRAPMRTTPTPTHAEYEQGRERVLSSHGSVNMAEEPESRRGGGARRATMIPREQDIGPDQSFFLND
ncbi:hypothetical protein HYDPIDRAFT_29366 [Hydnomerulius pinastri MD-312]|uniref:Uncharacterized protein n=1 Tax=Hydnomerulius pinastri MD-312 TaxID=994086 RepID=A0A0C9WEQ9_9AGAM|nr:hypothetical protein HYDPIDRAFT_29366 [Hydnomerulius pinastri MD-312]